MNNKIKQVVVLAGGRGSRLSPITDTVPKPLAPINGIPFLDYLIYSFVEVGIKQVLILLGYKGGLIKDRYLSVSDIKIDFSFGNEHEKTGRRVLNAYDQLEEHFLLVYGDNYWPIDSDKMIENYQKLNTAITTTVFSNKNGTGEYGFENNVVIGNDQKVLKYDKTRKTNAANGVDIGYFLIEKEALNPQMDGNISFELDILPSLIEQKQLGAYVTDKQYYYITNMKTLKAFEAAVFNKKFLPLSQKYFGEAR